MNTHIFISKLDNINLGYYVNDILNFIRRIYSKRYTKQNSLPYNNLLIKKKCYHKYSNSNFTTYVSRGKLINISNAVSLI